MKKESFSIELESLTLDEFYNPKDVDYSHLNDNIVMDFGSNQIEFFPSLCETIECVKEKCEQILDDIKVNYVLWPLSMPYELDYDVRPSSVTEEQYEYRLKLMEKYPVQKLLFSGIHFNYNYNEELIHELFDKQDKIKIYQDFKNETYFKVLKNMMFLSPLIIYFNSYSPLVSMDFEGDGLDTIGKNKGLAHSISFRNSLKYGYANSENFKINTDSFDGFIKGLEESIKSGELISEKEIYLKIRLKSLTRNLFNRDICYIEIRCIDLNPFCNSFDSTDLIFIQALLYDSLYNEFNFDYAETNHNIDAVSLEGLDKNLKVSINGLKTDFRDYFGNYLHTLMSKKYINNKMKEIILEKLKILENPKLHSAYKMRNDIGNNDLSIKEYGVKLSKGEI